MRLEPSSLLLYAVTDRAWTGEGSLEEQVEAALRGGATCIQLREKDISDEDFLKEAVRISSICRRLGAPFFVNDNVEIAVKSGADGVHVGQGDMPIREARRIAGPNMIIGASVHNAAEARQAAREGADYLGAGAVLPTPTKPEAAAISLEEIKAICRAVPIPVVAIGGINGANMHKLSGLGLAGFALVSAIFSAKDIEAECRRLRSIAERTQGD